MNNPIRTIFLVVCSLLCFSLIVSACDGDEAPVCNGDVYVESETVTRVTPAPDEDYADNTTHSWDEPPFGIEVTGSGEASLNIYYGSTFLMKYSAYAAGVNSYANFTVTKWNGSKEVSLAAGNYLIEDSDANDVCGVNVNAAGVDVSSIATKYIVTVRPETDEVTVAVLDGAVQVTSREQTVTLDAKMPEESLVVVKNGTIGPLMPMPDPDLLLEQVTTGKDIYIAPPPVEGLTMWVDDILRPVIQELAAQFEKDSGIPVQIEGMSVFEIGPKYLEAYQAGDAPDLIAIQHQQIDDLAAIGSVMPFKIMIDPAILIPGTLQAFNYKGQLYGVPYAYDNVALISNPEYVPEIPPTWSELRSYAAEISAGREFFTSLMIPSGGYFFYPVQSAFGGYIFGTYPDGTFNPSDLGMASDGSLAAASWYEEMVKTQPIFQATEEEALKYFQGGNAAMIVTGPWALPQLREMGVPFQIHSFPREVQESQPYLGVYGFLINRNTPSPSMAQTFLWGYLTTYDAVKAYSLMRGSPPARWDVLDSLEDLELRAFGLAGVNGTPIPYIPEMDAVWGPWEAAIRAIIDQTMTGYEAFINAQEVILKEIGQ